MSDLNTPPRRPGGRLASRPLHFIWLADGSGSMRRQGKIEALNRAINDAIPHMRALARENPQTSIFVNAVCFAEEARWMEEKLTPVSEFHWEDMKAGGATVLGEAFTMVGDVLQPPLMTDRALPPILALISDGLPTDDFYAGLDHLLSKPWGKRATRVVIALGEDANSEEAMQFFRAFVTDEKKHLFQVKNPEELIEAVRWVSTALLKSVASPLCQPAAPAEEEDLAGAVALGVDPGTADEAGLW